MQSELNQKPETNLLSLEILHPFRTILEALLSEGKPVVLAIDGRAASGKSSLAQTLAKVYQARVIHMDDFFLPRELRTEERLSEPGGNLHYERFMADVLPGLRKPEVLSYQVFDCSCMQLGEWRHLPVSQLSIIEGAYALHPVLGAYYDLSLFLSCSTETQLARVKARNPSKLKEFQKRWIPLEEAYINAFGIAEKAEYIIET